MMFDFKKLIFVLLYAVVIHLHLFNIVEASGVIVNVINQDNFRAIHFEVAREDADDPEDPIVKAYCASYCKGLALRPNLASIRFAEVNVDGTSAHLLSHLDCVDNLETEKGENHCSRNSTFQPLKRSVASLFSVATVADHLDTSKRSSDHLSKTGLNRVSVKCSSDEIDPRSEEFVTEFKDHQLEILNAVRAKYNSCLKKERTEEYFKFHDALTSQKRAVLPSDIVTFLDLINSEKTEWVKEAKKAGKTIRKNLILKDHDGPTGETGSDNAVCYTTPEGKVIIEYMSSKLGEGASKRADTRIGIDGNAKGLGEIEHLVALTGLDHSGSSVEHESEVYQYINSYRQEYVRSQSKSGVANPQLRGLAEATVVDLSQDKKALIQKRYAHDLTAWKPASFKEENRVFKNILVGLNHLHQMGLVHGDLKEANVMINNSEDLGISDYGLTYSPKHSVNTRTTASHEAPEMLREQHVTRSDLVDLVQKRDMYGYGIMMLNQISSFKNRLPSDLCKRFFINYEIVSENYMTCYETASKAVYEEASAYADKNCPPSRFPRDRSHCKYHVAADCLNPNPNLRPSSEALLKRASFW